jgi:hypothetical protein
MSRLTDVYCSPVFQGVQMNGVKSAFEFATIFAAYFVAYRAWILICLALVVSCGYKFFTVNYSMRQLPWGKLFLGSIVLTVLSNAYFWFDTKAELQQRNEQRGLELPR